MAKLMDLFGIGPLALLLSILLLVVLNWIEHLLNINKIVMSTPLLATAIILGLLGTGVCIYGLICLPPTFRGKKLVIHGAYRYSRHPIYSALIFLIYPAIALFLMSWLSLVAIVVVWLIFRILIPREEKHLIDIFGDEYREYMKNVPAFFPKLF